MKIKQACTHIQKLYLPIVILAILTAMVGGYYGAKLKLQTDLTALLPESFESVKALNRIKEEVGGIGQLRLVIESDDFSTAKNFADQLAPELLRSPYIKYVDYRNDVAFYKKNALLFLEPSELDSLYHRIDEKIAAEKQKLNPLFIDDLFGEEEPEAEDSSFQQMADEYRAKIPSAYYTNDDSTVLVMKIFPSSTNANLTFIREMLTEVKQIVAGVQSRSNAGNLQLFYGGNFKNKLDEFEVISDDILGTAFYGLGGVFLLIVIYFRRLLGALLISMTLVFSLAWTFGVTYAVLGELNTITGFLFVILFGLGIDYGIHAFARYLESREAGLSLEEAIEKMVCTTGKALLTTALTTSLAFFSLMLMDFRGFSDLGFIAGIGMLFALVAMVIVLPSFIILLEKRGWLKVKRKAHKSVEFQAKTYRFAKPILAATALITLFSAYALSQIQFEYDFTELRAITKERRLVSEKTRGVFKLSESPAVVLAKDEAEMQAIVAAVRQKMKADTASPTIDAVRSIHTLVPLDQEARLEKIRKIKQLVEDEAVGVLKGKDKELLDEFRQYLEVDRPFTWDEFPEKDKRQFINKRGEVGKFVFIYPSVALRDGKEAIKFRNDVGTIHSADGQVYHASSSNIILADMLVILTGEGRMAVLLTFLVVFLVVFLDFRSLKATLLVLSPLVIGILWMGGIMYLSGMKFNFFNIVVIPSVIGIGVDNGVHIYYRYIEEGRGSLYHVLRTTGVAIIMTNLTTIVGYSGLVMASHPGLNSIGDLAIIGLVSTFITALVVLPAILQALEKKILPAPTSVAASNTAPDGKTNEERASRREIGIK